MTAAELQAWACYLCGEVLSLSVETLPSGACLATDPDTGARFLLVVVTDLKEGE